MTPPSQAEMERAVVALIPFVDRWNLPLNPEHLHEIAFAVLENGDGPQLSDESATEIDERVRTQLDEFAKRMSGLYRQNPE